MAAGGTNRLRGLVTARARALLVCSYATTELCSTSQVFYEQTGAICAQTAYTRWL